MAELIKNNSLYYYNKGRGHCKHGIVYTMKDKAGQMWAIDTYWDSRFSKSLLQDTRYYSMDKVADDLEFIMMIEDITETNSGEFELYDSKDKLHIPVGGWHERFLINKNAKKNPEKVIDYITYKIDSVEREVKSLTNDHKKLKQWLNCVSKNPDVAQLYKNEKYEYDVELAMERAWGNTK